MFDLKKNNKRIILICGFSFLLVFAIIFCIFKQINIIKSIDSIECITDNKEYYKGQEDDDDFEKLVLLPKRFDLALRKFITKVSKDGKFNTVTELNPSRAPQVDTSKLKAGTATTADGQRTGRARDADATAEAGD